MKSKSEKSSKVKNIIHIILKIILSLILVMPIFGTLGFFPETTRDLYNTDAAFNFILTLMNDAIYIPYLMAIVFALSIFFLWSKREAFAALLLAPITLNIIGFHAFLDGGLLTGGAIMGNFLFVLNVYFLWKNRDKYGILLKRDEEKKL